MLTGTTFLRACRMMAVGCMILARSTPATSCNQIQFSRQLLMTFQGRPGKTTDQMIQSFQTSFPKVYNKFSTCGVGNFRQVTSVNVTRNAVTSFGFSPNTKSAGYFVNQSFTWAVKVQGVCQGCDAQSFQLFDDDPIAPTSPTKQSKAPFPKAPYPKAPTSSPTTCNCPAPRKSTFLQTLNSLALPTSIDAVLAITLLFEEPTCSSKIGQFEEYFVVTYSGDNSTNNNATVSCTAQSQLLEQLILETYNDLNALNTNGVCDTQFRRYTKVQLVKATDNGSRLLLGPSHQQRQLGNTGRRPTPKPTHAPLSTSCTYGTSGICSGPCLPGHSVTPDSVNRPSRRALNIIKRNKAIPIQVAPIESNRFVAHHQSNSTEPIDLRHRSLPVINGKCYCQANTVARRLPFRSEFIKALNNRLQVIGPQGAGVITSVSEVDTIKHLKA